MVDGCSYRRAAGIATETMTMTYHEAADLFLSGEIDSVALSDRLRALGYTWAEAEEHVAILMDVRADRMLADCLSGWNFAEEGVL